MSRVLQRPREQDERCCKWSQPCCSSSSCSCCSWTGKGIDQLHWKTVSSTLDSSDHEDTSVPRAEMYSLLCVCWILFAWCSQVSGASRAAKTWNRLRHPCSPFGEGSCMITPRLIDTEKLRFLVSEFYPLQFVCTSSCWGRVNESIQYDPSIYTLLNDINQRICHLVLPPGTVV